MRRSSRLAVPLRRPEDVIPHLGKPTHWKQGRSAKAVADIWFQSKNIPPPVRATLDTVDTFIGAEFLDGWLERETDLEDGRGTPSQTDLLALLGLADGLAVLGVEAKVDESFGKIVSEWLSDGGLGKRERLRSLCTLVRLDPEAVGHLRYQLLHRVAAVILEARRFRTDRAIILIHSFCPNATGLSDCIAFFDAIGIGGVSPGILVGGGMFAGVRLWAGWTADTPLHATALIDQKDFAI